MRKHCQSNSAQFASEERVSHASLGNVLSCEIHVDVVDPEAARRERRRWSVVGLLMFERDRRTSCVIFPLQNAAHVCTLALGTQTVPQLGQDLILWEVCTNSGRQFVESSVIKHNTTTTTTKNPPCLMFYSVGATHHTSHVEAIFI